MPPRLPRRHARYLFALLVTGVMSLVVCGVATLRSVGLRGEFLFTWLTAWPGSWAVAFPTVLVVTPMVHRIVDALCGPAR
ncbi:MAG: hypothetical protein JWR08_2483 [Enterovirga sp.]|jgi:hypothetical protein|nr:hypothetical protein [Enterovirga sp.]